MLDKIWLQEEDDLVMILVAAGGCGMRGLNAGFWRIGRAYAPMAHRAVTINQ